MENISDVIQNNYSVQNGKVVGYQVINQSTWINEWTDILSLFNINMDTSTITEITICIYSLAQNSDYNDKKGNVGRLTLFVDVDSLCLCTTEYSSNSSVICFAKYKGVKVNSPFIQEKYIQEVVETQRIENKLQLICDSGIILESN